MIPREGSGSFNPFIIVDRCAAINIYGRRCRATKDLTVYQYHGEPEIYGMSDTWPTWVAVRLCPKHYEAPAPKKAKKGPGNA